MTTEQKILKNRVASDRRLHSVWQVYSFKVLYGLASSVLVTCSVLLAA